MTGVQTCALPISREDYWNTIEEDFHWHIEILPQMSRITGFEWASGFFYNPLPPEVAARCLSADAPSDLPTEADLPLEPLAAPL